MRFVAVKIQARDGTIDWDRLMGEALRRLGNPASYTMWVDFPMSWHYQPQPWFPLYRLIAIDCNRDAPKDEARLRQGPSAERVGLYD